MSLIIAHWTGHNYFDNRDFLDVLRDLRARKKKNGAETVENDDC
jgi:hypothetical protein